MTLTNSLVNSFSQTSYTSSTTGWILGATYDYRVRAVNSKGPGEWSSTLTLVAPGLPIKMTTLQCTSRSLASMVFEWSPLTCDDTGKATMKHYNLRDRLASSTNEAHWVYLTGNNNFLSTTFT